MLDEKQLRNNIGEINELESRFSKSNQILEMILDSESRLTDEIHSSFDRYLHTASNRVLPLCTESDRALYLNGVDSWTSDNLFKREGKVLFDLEEYDPVTIHKICSYRYYLPIKNEIEKLYDAYYTRIQTLLTQVKPLSKGTFGWLLTKKAVKAEAVRAANDLLQLAKTDFLDEVDSYKREFDSLAFKGADMDYQENHEWYYTFLDNYFGSNVYHTKSPDRPNFSELRENLSSIRNVMTSLQELIDETRMEESEIIALTRLLCEEAAQELLNEISVDELNRDHSGIRVGLLKSEGIHFISDVLKKSMYELSDINGISDAAAKKMKELAEEIKEEAISNVKPRIDMDHRTRISNNLVKKLCDYIEIKDFHDSVNKIGDDSKPVKEVFDFLEKNGNEVKWFTSMPNIRKKIVSSISRLNKYLSGDFFKRAVKVINSSVIPVGKTFEESWNDFSKNSATYYAVLEELVPGLFGSNDKYYGLPEELAKEIEEECIFPDGLLVTLRRYQEWGVKYILHQERVLLGDEMGLGKTIQALATMVSLKNTGATHFMVVCPASVIINWVREVQTRSRLNVYKIHGSQRDSAFDSWLRNGGVAVTTYETTGVLQLPDDFKFSMLVVDEAHYIKNPTAKRSQNVVDISKHADRLLFMTGTALENNVNEMVKLIGDLQPDVARSVEHIKYLSGAEKFREKVAPVYYRRKREDVLKELPELIENKEWCSLLPEEEKMYESHVLKKNYANARKVSWHMEDLSQSAKAKRLLEIIEDAKEDGRKVIVFSYFLETIQAIKSFLGDICSDPITGSIAPSKRQEIIDDFDKAPVGSVLLAQIQAGGTGLNIQSASVVVITEPQFKPSIENQAISRAYRMGQTRSVLVHRLLATNSIDEKVIELLEKKQEIFDAFADESVAAKESFELDNKTFGNIIEEEIERINLKNGYTRPMILEDEK